jgi:hypothetical protein
MRPDEQARREQQSAAARGEEPPAQQAQVQVFEQRTYTAFLLAPVAVQPDGSKVLQFLTPDGKAHLWPIGEEQARGLGQQLLAPSVHVAGAGEMPPPTNGNGGRVQ